MGARNLKKAEGTPVDRVIRLISKLMDAHGGVPFKHFFDDDWGSERTMRRLLTSINELWEYHRGIALFEFVQDDGAPWIRGTTRYIRLKDVSVRTTQIGNLALMPAFMQFMRILRGTHFESEFRDLFSGTHMALSPKDRAFIRQAQNKFYYVAKGIKDYRNYSDQIGSIYKGLLSNRILKVRRRVSSGDQATIVLKLLPLTLINFNSGLYLLALNAENQQEVPKKYRIEMFEKVECLDETFIYPALFDPNQFFRDSFGIYSSEGAQEYGVKIALLTKEIEEYVRQRKWTHSDQYTNIDGLTILSFRVKDLVEVTSWVLSFGDTIKVIAPSELRDAVIKKFKNSLRNYSM